MVDACRAAGVGRLVQVSSPSVAHAGRPLCGAGADPADPAGARGHYARTKAESELVALAADSADLAVLAVRPHLVWGPGDTQLVARLVARARAGRLPVLGAGAALIDTTYVDDAASALVAAVDACGPGAHGEALVVSGGEPRPVGEILERVCRAAGVPPPRLHVPVGLGAGRRVGRRPGVGSDAARTDTPPLTRFLAEQLTHGALVRPAPHPAAAALGARGRDRRGLRAAGRAGTPQGPPRGPSAGATTRSPAGSDRPRSADPPVPMLGGARPGRPDPSGHRRLT